MVANKFYEFGSGYHQPSHIFYQQQYQQPIKPVPTYYSGQYGGKTNWGVWGWGMHVSGESGPVSVESKGGIMKKSGMTVLV